MLAFFRRQNGRAFFPPLPIAALLPRSWRGAYSNGGAWDALLQLGYFCDAKCQRGFETTLAFLCEPEGLSPDGGLSYSANTKLHQTGEPRGPLPSGGKTQAKSLFLYASAR